MKSLENAFDNAERIWLAGEQKVPAEAIVVAIELASDEKNRRAVEGNYEDSALRR